MFSASFGFAGRCDLPELSLLEGGGFEGRHDAEVVGAAFESFPEVRVRGLSRVDHQPARQDDL